MYLSFFDSAEGVQLTPRRCLRLLHDHQLHEDDEVEFFEHFGFSGAYDAQQVLAWLGY
ncbi:MAG: hypothetical protein JWN04_5005 [Myxococcaceae bacterium]|nr:hypothetical protein [Myxococcaceae bacterium]